MRSTSSTSTRSIARRSSASGWRSDARRAFVARCGSSVQHVWWGSGGENHLALTPFLCTSTRSASGNVRKKNESRNPTPNPKQQGWELVIQIDRSYRCRHVRRPNAPPIDSRPSSPISSIGLAVFGRTVGAGAGAGGAVLRRFWRGCRWCRFRCGCRCRLGFDIQDNWLRDRDLPERVHPHLEQTEVSPSRIDGPPVGSPATNSPECPTVRSVLAFSIRPLTSIRVSTSFEVALAFSGTLQLIRSTAARVFAVGFGRRLFVDRTRAALTRMYSLFTPAPVLASRRCRDRLVDDSLTPS